MLGLLWDDWRNLRRYGDLFNQSVDDLGLSLSDGGDFWFFGFGVGGLYGVEGVSLWVDVEVDDEGGALHLNK